MLPWLPLGLLVAGSKAANVSFTTPMKGLETLQLALILPGKEQHSMECTCYSVANIQQTRMFNTLWGGRPLDKSPNPSLD